MILTLFLTNQQLVAKSVHSGRDMNEELCKLVVIFAEFAIYNQQLGIMLGNLQNTSQICQIARCPILLYNLWMHHQGQNSSASYQPSLLWERDKGEKQAEGQNF